jgi:hypothetical protein
MAEKRENKAVLPMIHIPIPDTFIGVPQITSDSRDIPRES